MIIVSMFCFTCARCRNKTEIKHRWLAEMKQIFVFVLFQFYFTYVDRLMHVISVLNMHHVTVIRLQVMHICINTPIQYHKQHYRPVTKTCIKSRQQFTINKTSLVIKNVEFTPLESRVPKL